MGVAVNLVVKDWWWCVCVLFFIFIKGLVVLNLNVNGCLVKEILRKLKEKINKGKEFVKKRKFIFFFKLTWLFFGHLSVDVATKNSDFI